NFVPKLLNSGGEKLKRKENFTGKRWEKLFDSKSDGGLASKNSFARIHLILLNKLMRITQKQEALW
ncbi:hypothetical protein PIB30_028946, partial [Stylosanthes scabra]|nr:hypothetical protein [Stylosanthes scabra]